LLAHAASLTEVAESQTQLDAIRDERRLLDTPDPVPSIHKSIVGLLRKALNKAHGEFAETYDRQKSALEASENWKKLKGQQHSEILAAEGIGNVPELKVGDDTALLASLDEASLAVWKTRTQAIPQQFANAALAAAKLLEPKTQRVHLSSNTLKAEQDVKNWLANTEKDLLAKLKDGPIVIS
jgi:hypothetical protein